MHSKVQLRKIKKVIAREREGCHDVDAEAMLDRLASLIDEGCDIDDAVKQIEPTITERVMKSLLYRVRNLSMN